MTTSRPFCLRNGVVIDGTGSQPRPADVLVTDGRITALLRPGEAVGDDVEQHDVSGLAVAPGFIDSHSHADNVPLLSEADTSKIEQGVTTEIVGNCGFSLAPTSPLHGTDLETLLRRIFPPHPLPWHGFDEFLRHADAGGYVTNYAPLVGHNVLRVTAFGSADRAPSDAEAQQMADLLEQALDAGAFGLSSGLIYPPGLFSAPDEVSRLTARLGKDRVYATHMRNESDKVHDSVAEAVAAASAAGCRLHVSHLKVAHRSLWGAMDTVLAQLDRAADDGVAVSHDVYPYTAGSTMLTALLPPWFHDGGSAGVLARLRSADALAAAQRDLDGDGVAFENFVLAAGWHNIVVSSTASHRYEGETLARLAEQFGISPLETLARVLVEEELAATMVMHSMHSDDMHLALAHPRAAVGSDGLPPGTGGRPHPRTYGTFPRVLGPLVRLEHVLSLPDAVRKMTSLPASIFGIADRGTLAAGQVADIVCFDADTVADRATYADPVRRPTGIVRVYQAGQVVVEDGQWQGKRLGTRLTPS